jgi:hypothetical protein
MMRRLRVCTAAAVAGACAAIIVGSASPAWAPVCGPFSLDVKDATRVWVGTIIGVDDASSRFSAPTLAGHVFALSVVVQEVLKGPPAPGVQLVYTNSFAPMSASELRGLQTVFALPDRQRNGAQWDSLECHLGTSVGELRGTAAAALDLTLRTPLPPPAPLESGPTWFAILASVVVAVALALAAFETWRRRRSSVRPRATMTI